MGFPLSFGRPGRHRAALAAVCLALIVLTTAVQVLHHCTAFELNREPGTAPVYCAVCMSVQVATLAVAALVWMVARRLQDQPLPLLQVAPEFGACFALSVRPPPSF